MIGRTDRQAQGLASQAADASLLAGAAPLLEITGIEMISLVDQRPLHRLAAARSLGCGMSAAEGSATALKAASGDVGSNTD